MHKIRILINGALVLAVLATAVYSPPARAQEDPDTFIAKLIEQMTPQAKVGQLFVVAFSGADTKLTSDVATLILQYNIGGVILSPAAGNIINTGNTPLQVATLTSSLQGLAYTASQRINPNTGKTAPFIPLFIVTPYETRVASYTHEIRGMTPLLSPLALGATWNPENAQNAGRVIGQELSALGINVLLGPALDVLNTPSLQASAEDTQAFGGDPYWVSVMGKAFVSGVRAGSQGRVMAVPSHFPGQGQTTSSEGTIDKSLDEIRKFDLFPFTQAMNAPAEETRPLADALAVTQVRYRGFLGNIRERTRPLAVDAQAMQALLAVPEVKEWRDKGGGVLFSDSLGSPYLRQYYNPLGAPVYRAAQEAFLAGNDVLILSDFGGDDWPAQFNAVTTTIAFFQDKYSTDLNFQTRVNDAVARILRLKYRLYPGFDPAAVPANVQTVNTRLGRGMQFVIQVAQEAATQLWPLPARPGAGAAPAISPESALVIITQDRLVRDCKACPLRHIIDPDILGRTLTQTWQVEPARVTNLRLSDLRDYVAGAPRQDAPDVGEILAAADWIILVFLDAQPDLGQILVEHPAVLGDKKIVALSFGAPHALSKEEISRLTAYYCLYGHTAPFIDTAARILLGELPAQGAPPISIPAIGYDLTRQTEPDPAQVIQIHIDQAVTGDQTPAPLDFKAGDTLKLRTSPIVDRNGHPVPDGTLVTFTRLFSRTTELPPQTVGTQSGVAKVEFVLDKDKIGPLLIRALSEPALTSYELQVVIQKDKPAAISSVIPPTLTPTPIPPTLTPTPLPTATPTPTPTPVPPWWAPLAEPAAPRRVSLDDLLMALLGIAGMGLIAYRLMFNTVRATDKTDREIAAVRWGLWCSSAGLAGYILYSLGAPPVNWLDSLGSTLAALSASLLFAMLPLAVALGLQRRAR